MKIYEVTAQDDVLEDGPEYFGRQGHACRRARDLSAESIEENMAGDEETVPGIPTEVRVFEFKPTKSNVIAALNGYGWKPETRFVARYKDGKQQFGAFS